jgi:chromosome segregation ATPase
MAALALLETMEQAYEQLNRLKTKQPSVTENVEQTRLEIQKAEERLREMGVVCDRNPECRKLLSRVVVGLRQLVSPLGEETSNRRINQLADTVEELATVSRNQVETTKVVNESALAAKQEQNAEAALKALEEQRRIQMNSQMQHEQRLQTTIENLEDGLQRANDSRVAAENKLKASQARINESQAEQMVVVGDCTKELMDQQHKLRAAESLNQTLVAREFALSKSMEKLQESQKTAASLIAQLKASYESKLEGMRDTRIPAARERELLDEIDRYKRELEQAVKGIEVANASGRQALDHANKATQPSADIAKELLQVNAQLKSTTHQLAEAQDQRESLRERLGKAEVACSNRAAAQSLDQKKYTKDLELRISESLRNVAKLTDERKADKSRIAELETARLQEIGHIQSKLDYAEAELKQHKIFMRQQEEHLKLQAASAAAVTRAQQSKVDYERQQLETALQRDFDAKHRDLLERFRYASEKFNEQKHELRRVQERLKEEQISLNRRVQQQQRSEAMFAERQTEYTAQKDKLSEARSISMLQVRRFEEIEREFTTRIRLLTAELMQAREQHKQRMEGLQREVKEVLASKHAIVRRLEACEIAQDASVARTQELASSKSAIEQKYRELSAANSQLQSRCDGDKQALRNKYQNLAKTLTMCESRLGDYDRFVAENRALRAEAQARLKEVHSNKDSLERLRQIEHDHHRARQRLIELEAALHESVQQRQALENTVANLTANLANLNRDRVLLEQSKAEAQEAHEKRLRDVEHKMAEERQAINTRATEMDKRETRLNQHKDKLQKHVRALESRQEIVNNTLLDTIQSGANQVASLLRIDPSRDSQQDFVQS